MTFLPFFWCERSGEQASSHIKKLNAPSENVSKVVVSILNSSLFYWWFLVFSNCRDLTSREIREFSVGIKSMRIKHINLLSTLCKKLMRDYKNNAKRKECYYKTSGIVNYDEFYPRYSKPIIDEIDKILSEHYGFNGDKWSFPKP